MKIVAAVALILALGMPAHAEGVRPLPRPAAVERIAAFSGATDLAPRIVIRPRHAPGVPGVAAEVAQLPPQTALAALARPGLLPEPIADPARVSAQRQQITMSASNAVIPPSVAVAAAVEGLRGLPRPARRPEALVSAVVRSVPASLNALGLPRPRARPEGLVAPVAATVAPRQAAIPALAVAASPRPAPRPRGLGARAARPNAAPAQIVKAAAIRTTPGQTLVVPKKGALCGDPAIKGASLAPITSRVQGCGIAQPVRVTEVDGVRLSTPATLDCDTARALRQWVTTGLKPAAGKAGVSEIRVAAHYACRPRNNIRGARVSEHGRGKAIDIAGVTLANGQSLSVLGDYRRADLLQKVRRAACGIFGTTLGPGSDRFHSDHFHFDTARHRNGPYCR